MSQSQLALEQSPILGLRMPIRGTGIGNDLTIASAPHHPSARQGGQTQAVGEGSALRAVLLDSVMHEVRTPLTSIKLAVTELLADSQLQASQRDELLAIINEEADRLNRLIGEAGEMARLDADLELEMEPHAIEEIIDATLKECRRLLGARSIKVQVPAGLPPVRADINRVKKALMQLLENAHKYSPLDEPIIIISEMNGDFVMVSVADCGGGIDDSEQALIFKRCYRGKDQRSVVQGTGMGLPIAKAIVEAHGGSLTVTSQRDHGCIFTFTLPIDRSTEPGFSH